MELKLKKIKIYYLIVFALGVLLIAPTHIFPPPTFMYARFPHYLEMMKPFLGISWPASFEIYHYVLYLLGLILSINVLGIFFYPKFKNSTIYSSIIGIFLFSLIILFFFFVFLNVNAPTALIYGFYFVTLLIVDILTFKALIKEQKAV